MAAEQNCVDLSFEADADMSANFLELVKVTSTGVVVCSTQGERADGVLKNKPGAANRAAQVTVLGRTKVYAGATITRGALITAGADGRAEVAASGDFVCGRALTGGADGEIIDILFIPSNGTALA